MIRSAVSEDYEQIKNLIVEAFTNSEYGYTGEAELVEKIRQEKNYIELVYLEGNKVVGHGILSESHVEDDFGETVKRGLVLAPLSVLPDYQNQGIGEKIITELEKKVDSKYGFISILGDPSYYNRFGYEPASKFGIKPPFEVPREYFLIKQIKSDGLKNSDGTLKYCKAFD